MKLANNDMELVSLFAEAFGLIFSMMACASFLISYKRKKNYQPYRPKRRVFRKLSLEEQNKLIKENPDYGQIVCRCEFITKGEILDAIDSPVVPTSVDAIKRRTRAGMGRCQGGFCLPVVLQILAQAQQQDCTEIDFTAKDTNILEKIKN